MDRDFIFINVIILICLLFVLWQALQMIVFHGKTESTEAVITDTAYANPNRTPFRNSKWATVSYKADGEKYISKKRIQVAMNANVGEKVEIKFLKKSPNIIVSFSYKRLLIGLVITLIFLLARYYLGMK